MDLWRGTSSGTVRAFSSGEGPGWWTRTVRPMAGISVLEPLEHSVPEVTLVWGDSVGPVRPFGLRCDCSRGHGFPMDGSMGRRRDT